MMNSEVNGDRGMRAVDLTPEEIQSMRQYPNPSNDRDDVMSSELDVPSAICLTLLKDNVMPRCKGSRFTSDEKRFIHMFNNAVY